MAGPIQDVKIAIFFRLCLPAMVPPPMVAGMPINVENVVIIPYWRTVPPSEVKYSGRNESAMLLTLAIDVAIISVAMFPFGIMSFVL